MPWLDQTGPRGQGPRTGRGRGFCPPPAFGQEVSTPLRYGRAERPPTAHETSLWDRAEKLMRKCVLLATITRYQHKQLMIAAKFAAAHGVTFDTSELPEMESRMLNTLSLIERLRRYHCDVNGQQLGVRLSANGDDLDIIQPQDIDSFGQWQLIAIGVVLLIGIIARWIYVENDVTTISEKYNHVLTKADNQFCADPGSKMCADWKAEKAKGDYAQHETLVDSVKRAVGTVGSGLGTGLMLLIPLAALMYLPRKRSQNG
jgi:hypothetical protein